MASSKQSTSLEELSLSEAERQDAQSSRDKSLLAALSVGPSHPFPADIDPAAIANAIPAWTTGSTAFAPMRMMQQTNSLAITNGGTSGSPHVLSGSEMIIARQLANCSLSDAGDANRWRNQNVLVPDDMYTAIGSPASPKESPTRSSWEQSAAWDVFGRHTSTDPSITRRCTLRRRSWCFSRPSLLGNSSLTAMVLALSFAATEPRLAITATTRANSRPILTPTPSIPSPPLESWSLLARPPSFTHPRCSSTSPHDFTSRWKQSSPLLRPIASVFMSGGSPASAPKPRLVL